MFQHGEAERDARTPPDTAGPLGVNHASYEFAAGRQDGPILDAHVLSKDGLHRVLDLTRIGCDR
jgi:hypothetical protein